MFSVRSSAPLVLGHYELHEPIAHGGMASVYLGRVRGAKGFARLVAIKRLHPQFARDEAFAAMLLDEARVASRIRHPNVVAVTDVEALDDEILLVMDYVRGEALSSLLQAANGPIPPAIAARIARDALRGLAAAHETTDAQGLPLRIVHRDISPQNVLVGADGITRIIDFGIANFAGRARITSEGALRGKIAYMPAEQLRGERVSTTTDVYAMGVVLWELLKGARLHGDRTEAQILLSVLTAEAPSVGDVPGVGPALANVVARALGRDRSTRYASAQLMGEALEAAIPLASDEDVKAWVSILAEASLAARDACVARVESAPRSPTTHPGVEDAPAVTEPPIAPIAGGASLPAPSVEAWSSRARAPSHPWRGRLVLGGVALVIGSMLAGSMLSSSAAARAGASVVTTSSPPAASSIVLAVTAPEPATTPTGTPSVPPSSSPRANSSPAPTVTARVPVLSAPAGRGVSVSPSRSAAQQQRCVPPFTLDSAGRRLYKRECL